MPSRWGTQHTEVDVMGPAFNSIAAAWVLHLPDISQYSYKLNNLNPTKFTKKNSRPSPPNPPFPHTPLNTYPPPRNPLPHCPLNPTLLPTPQPTFPTPNPAPITQSKFIKFLQLTKSNSKKSERSCLCERDRREQREIR